MIPEHSILHYSSDNIFLPHEQAMPAAKQILPRGGFPMDIVEAIRQKDNLVKGKGSPPNVKRKFPKEKLILFRWQ